MRFNGTYQKELEKLLQKARDSVAGALLTSELNDINECLNYGWYGCACNLLLHFVAFRQLIAPIALLEAKEKIRSHNEELERLLRETSETIINNLSMSNRKYISESLDEGEFELVYDLLIYTIEDQQLAIPAPLVKAGEILLPYCEELENLFQEALDVSVEVLPTDVRNKIGKCIEGRDYGCAYNLLFRLIEGNKITKPAAFEEAEKMMGLDRFRNFSMR